MNKILTQAASQMNPEYIMLSKRSQAHKPHIVSSHLDKISRRSKSIETQSKLVCSMGWGWVRKQWGGQRMVTSFPSGIRKGFQLR